MSTTQKAQRLTWSDLYKHGRTDSGNRYYPSHAALIEYVEQGGYRSPSRAWPWSYAKALLTQKAANWLAENHPDFYNEVSK